MKETLVKIPLFGVAAALLYIPFLGLFQLYLAVLPGRDALVFSSVMAMGLLPSLAGAFFITINSHHHHPGKPLAGILLTMGLFLAALTMSFIFPSAMEWVPPTNSGLVPGRILEDNAGYLYVQDYSQGQLNGLIYNVPGKQDQNLVFKTQARWNADLGRIIFPDGDAGRTLEGDSGESQYFSPGGILAGTFNDIHFTFGVLASPWKDPSVSWFARFNRFLPPALGLTFLLSGFIFLFHIHIWPLIKWVMVLLGARLVFFYFRFCFHDAVYVASQGVSEGWVLEILPFVLLILGAGFLMGISFFRLPFKSPKAGTNA